jgi:ubiquinone/menaquinone biosynthesis C-methylase UbiE
MLSPTEPTHKDVIQRTFSESAEHWRKIYEVASGREGIFRTEEMVERRNAVLRVIDRYADDRKLSVLDVGCGTGMTMREILRRGHSVVGVDITEAMLHQAKSVLREFTADRACCILSDGENIPCEDGAFDVVICVGVLQYLQTDEKSVSEMRRVVRDGGLVILTLPNMFRISNLLDPYYYLVRGVQFLLQKRALRTRGRKSLSPVDFSLNRRFANRRYYYGQLSDLFDRGNLRQVSIAGIGFGPMTFWGKELLPDSLSMRISRLLERVARKRYFGSLKTVANRWVICLRKSAAEAREATEQQDATHGSED